MNGSERRTLSAALVVQIAAAVPVFLVGALASHLRTDLGLTGQVIGAAISAFYASTALAAYPLGSLCDRIGWHRAAKVSSAGIVVALAGVGLLADEAWHLVVFLALAGVSHSLASSAASVALAVGTPPAHHGVLFGIKQSAIPVATMFAGLSIPLIAERLGHRPAFLVATALPLLAIAFSLGRDKPNEQRARTRTPAAKRAANTASGAVTAPRRRFDARLTMLMISCAMGSAGTSALSAFFVVSAVDHGVSASRAGVVLAVASGLSIGTRVVGGWIADRTATSGFLQASILLVVGSVGYGLLATGNTGLLVVAALLAYGAGWGWPGLAHFGAVQYRPGAPGTVTGVIRTGLATGATLGPIAYGFVTVASGYTLAWAMVAAWAAVGGTAMFFTRPRRAIPDSVAA